MENETVLDVIERRLESMNAKSFVLRVAYIGEHESSDLSKFYQDSIKRINSGYCDVSLAGFLLVYENRFIVVMEGSEDTIMRHVDSVLNSGMNMKRLKLLAVYHNVEKRFFSSWRSFYTDPPLSNFKDVDLTSESEMLNLVSECMKKIHSLISIIVNNPELIVIGDINSDVKSQAFPEISLLDPILSSPCIMNLKDYLNMYMTLPEYCYSFEKCWPAPFDFTPTLESRSRSAAVHFPPLEEIIENCRKKKQEREKGENE